MLQILINDLQIVAPIVLIAAVVVVPMYVAAAWQNRLRGLNKLD